MTADNGPLITAFLDAVFREENRRGLSESHLVMRLEDYLFTLRERHGEEEYPRSAENYLNDWADDSRGWLRKYYPPGSDEPHYDLTPATEKALGWLDTLFEENFVGTESRLLTVFNLLRQIVHGVEEDRDVRLATLQNRRDEIDAEIESVKNGDIPLLDARGIRERFQQFSRTARELLGDFRAVEQNFRDLDRRVREEIATWDGEKSALLEKIFGEHDAITGSDQGMSFRAFWDFLMSPASQEELSRMLDRVYEIEELGEALEDTRLRRIHYDWMSASEQTQRTVARLSRQLRSFLDDRAFYENRRIIELLGRIEKKAHTLKDSPPREYVAELDGVKPEITLPMERPLYTPPLAVDLETVFEEEDELIDHSLLFQQTFVDKTRLLENLEQELRKQGQISLGELILRHPLTEGLTELITWFSIAAEEELSAVDETATERIEWKDSKGILRRAEIPMTIFSKRNRNE